MAKRIIHLSLDVRGGMANARDLVGHIAVDGKTLRTVPEIRNFLQGMLDQGYEKIPMAECDNFDCKKGCLGHFYEKED